MIAEREANPYDFRKPSRLPDGIEQRLSEWLRGTCLLVPEIWSERISSLLTVTSATPETMRVSEALALLPDPAIGYHVIPGTTDLESLIVFPRQLGLAMVAEMLGETNDELPAERELTAVEHSLCELALKDWMRALSEAWPDHEPRSCSLRQYEPRPQRSRLFSAKDKAILCRFEISGPWGTQPIWWVLPHKPILEILSHDDAAQQEISTENQRNMEALALEIPVQVIVRLGSTSLHVAELASLSAGDVVVLDQRITEALVAEIAGEEKYRVWPGRVGARQAIQIESLVDN
ncbi:MAG: FliM/FliN family flagellar motor switch protein [Gammaproteobacteria bacterium]|nr:FliM/FliN family flagellar motor switch protein [Gammaproteobacteria bacterium]